MRSELRKALGPTVTLTSPPTVVQTEGSKAGSQPSSPPLIHSSVKGSASRYTVFPVRVIVVRVKAARRQVQSGQPGTRWLEGARVAYDANESLA